MNTTLYYFSGTGNSLMIARNLADTLGDCQLVPIAQAMQEEHPVVTIERVGFVFPLYYVGLPKLVHDFISKLDISPTTYSFTVITRGVPMMGGAIGQVKALLRQKSVTLHAGFYINMPSNYILWSDAPAQTKQQNLFAQADKKVQQIAGVIRGELHQYDIEPFGFIRPLRNDPYRKQAYERDKHFVVESQCNSCGICAKVCPVDNITMTAGKPHWRHQCQECLTCLQFCPKHAIQYGQKTVNKTRYHHPAVTVKEIMAQKIQ
jgi:ferredoxin